jgi:hypothetical protein
LALAAYLDGDYSRAYALVAEGLALFQTIKSDAGLAEASVTMGHILRAQGNLT